MQKLKHILILFCSILFIILNINTLKCSAAPALSTAVSIEQPNGLSFEANQYGDEWSNWTTDTASGNVIIEDSDNYWKYAEVSFGELVPSEAKVGIDPVPQNTVKNEEWTNILGNYSEKSKVPKYYYASGDTPQSSVPIEPAGSPQKILVLLVSFSDKSIQNTDSAWSNNFFGDSGKTVKTYYQENSHGSFYFSPASESYGAANDGIIRVTLNYAHPNTGGSIGDPNRKIVSDALQVADPYINFASYDTNGNGYIDANELHIVTIIAGYERSCGVVTPNVWGHRWSLFGTVPPPLLDGKYVGAYGYTQQGEIHAQDGDHMATIGILCHELGHDLGLFDEYDTSSGGSVVGASSVMDGGSWGRANGDYAGSSPTSMDPYSKIYLGFANPLVVTSGQQLLNTAATGSYNIVKIPTQNANQYFLVENRNLTSFDIGLQYNGITNGGIAIWHINEDSISAYKFADTVNNSGHNPGVWLEKTGTPWDPYYRNGGVKDLFSDTTTPNSKLYDGSSTNVKIQALDATAAMARVQIGDPSGVGFETLTYSINENAGNVTMNVKRTNASGTLTVDYASADGTATAGSDYTAVSGTLSFADGEASKTITVPILDDTVYEGNENFTLTLSNQSAGTIGTASSTVTILENEEQPTVIYYKCSDLTLGENNGGYAIEVSRKGNLSGTLSIDYCSQDGTAKAGSDYTGITGTLNFNAGEESKYIYINILEDQAVEDNEVFKIVLSNASKGTIEKTDLNVTVIDDDFEFSQANYTVNENNGNVMLTVQRKGYGTVGLVNYVATDETAKNGSDYILASGSITFGQLEQSKTISVPIKDDTVYEGNETFKVTITSSVGGTTLGPYSTTVTIIDDDEPTPLLSFNPTAYTVNENSGTVSLTVTRSVVTAGTLTVDYTTADDTAFSASDYTATSGTLTFADSETSKTITIPIQDDNLYEGNESFNVNLSNQSAGNITEPTAVITIIENETPPVIAFNPTNYTIAEDGESVILAVYRSENTAGSVSVNFNTVNATALSGSDYTAQSGTLTFTDGETYKPIVININDDTYYESSETFKVNLSTPVGGILGADYSATVTITDNDLSGGTPVGLIKTAKPYVSSGTLGKCSAGQTQQLIIIATFENGVTMDISALATWNSEYTTVATVDKGLITGVVKGVTKINFTYKGQTFSFLYTIN